MSWDVDEALRTAGFDPIDIPRPAHSPLEAATDDELIAEIRRRMKGAHRGLESETQPSAPTQVGQAQEDASDSVEPSVFDIMDTDRDALRQQP